MSGNIPVRPSKLKKVKSTSTKKALKPTLNSGSGNGGSGGGGRGGRGGGGRGGGAYARAQSKAGKKYLEQARNLEANIAAINFALGSDGLQKVLNKYVADAKKYELDYKNSLLGDHALRMESLSASALDNEDSQGAESTNNLNNMLRERYSGISQAMNLGVGETDALNTMQMSLRNWQANQSDVERSYSDTLTSINASVTDLNVDTRNALMKNEADTNSDIKQMYTDYFNQRSDLYTDLGNIRGQQADYFASAEEYGVTAGKAKKGAKKAKAAQKSNKLKTGVKIPTYETVPTATGRAPQKQVLKPKEASKKIQQKVGKAKLGNKAKKRGQQNSVLTVRNTKQTFNAASEAFMNAAEAKGEYWDDPGISEETKNWAGGAKFQRKSNMNNLAMAPKNKIKRPEGAVLRTW